MERALNFKSLFYLHPMRIITLLIFSVCLSVEAQNMDKHLGTTILENGQLYFVRPIKMKVTEPQHTDVILDFTITIASDKINNVAHANFTIIQKDPILKPTQYKIFTARRTLFESLNFERIYNQAKRKKWLNRFSVSMNVNAIIDILRNTSTCTLQYEVDEKLITACFPKSFYNEAKIIAEMLELNMK